MDGFLIFGLIILFSFMPFILGLVVGTWMQNQHEKDMDAREAKLTHMLVFNHKRPPVGMQFHNAGMCVGNIVLTSDPFRRFLAGISKIVGGRVVGYENMIQRARREAVLRVKEEAAKLGADTLLNLRLETSAVSYSRSGIATVEILAYATAAKQQLS